MIALSLAVFLVALDSSIIATVIPKITDEFQSLDNVGWYGSAYLLALAATQLLFGKFYTFLPVKLAFLVSISLWTWQSSGLGSAGIFTGALIIIAHSVPLEKRPVYTGLIGSMYGIASVVGPLMGGVFTDKVSWRWCFLINLPIGAVTLVVITFFFKMPKSGTVEQTESQLQLTLGQKIAQFETWGTLAFVPAIVWPFNGECVRHRIRGGPDMEARKRHCPAAYLHPAQYLGRRLVQPVYRRIVHAPRVYLPIWFQAIKGTTAIKSGIDCLLMILSMVLASLIAGILTTAFGYYTAYVLLSSVLMAVGAGLLSTFKTNTGHSHWIGYQIIFGFGFGFGMQGPLITAQTVLELKDVPIGTTINNFLRPWAAHYGSPSVKISSKTN
ncbi:MFS transporter [Mycena sanguinolenta]|nr:MFS transporter [Mycena sanguinolenta]